MSGVTYSFKLTTNNRFFANLHGNFITLIVFARDVLRGSRRRNIFLNLVLLVMSDIGFVPCLISHHSTYMYRVRHITFFFWKMLEKKKRLNIFSNFFFYLKVQSFRLTMENNFIQMAVSAGHAVAYTIGSIFKHIIDCVQLYFTNGLTNIVL